MISNGANEVEARTEEPTVWGLDAVQLHDRFWASRGVQVVRQGVPIEIVDDAELFLLCDRRLLTIFRFGHILDILSWEDPDLLTVRLHDQRELGYREHAATDAEGRFLGFERIYGGADRRLGRVAITTDRQIAQAWQNAPDVRTGWQRLRRQIVRQYRAITSVDASVYDGSVDQEKVDFLRHLVRVWKRPDTTVARARRGPGRVWRDEQVQLDPGGQFVGPVWVGAGRELKREDGVVGPAVLWDAPKARPALEDVRWKEIEPVPGQGAPIKPPRQSSTLRIVKRGFDIVFALFALAVTLPLYPLIMLAIWLEDGRPFFFAHTRESMGGREFPCIKFRSMRKDAEQIKLELQKKNRADGPQFFVDDDPRQTRVGRFLRTTNLDEVPQFINVLLGHMSVVGPRPSPRKENQFCPAWRETRLSVRPGVTGLWQIKRSRREGLDFQEWIMYDIEYVERCNLALDVYIIWKTFLLLIRGTKAS